MKEMLAGQAGVQEYRFEGMDKIAGYAPVEITKWSVGTTQPVSEFLEAADHIRNLILAVGAGFLAITIVAVAVFRTQHRSAHQSRGGHDAGRLRRGGVRFEPGVRGQSVPGGGRQPAGRLDRGDLLLPGGDIFHDQTKRRQRDPGQSAMKESARSSTQANVSMQR